MNSRISGRAQKTLCFSFFPAAIFVPLKTLQIWVKRFSEYLAYELSDRPDSWRGFWYIYLLSSSCSELSALNGFHFYF